MTDVKESITRKVGDQLYWDNRIDTSDIKIDVVDGNVKLSGTVPTHRMCQAAEEDAWAISGVTFVDNQLTLRNPDGVKPPTDEIIKTHAENALNNNPSIDVSTINVSVEHGTATLEGSVNAYWKKLIAENLISDISHIKKVVNKLSVVPTMKVEDKEIADNITQAMDRNKWIDIDTVNVKVEKGVVTLSGKVSNWAAYRGASDSANYTEGVIDVINKLKYK